MGSSQSIVIGSGIGGLSVAGLLARYGKKVIVCESHSIAGGAVHSFSREGFHFDSGASFYCGLDSASNSWNPLRQVLSILGEQIEVIPYDPLGHYYFPDAVLPIYSRLDDYRAEVAKITLQGAEELLKFHENLLGLYNCLRNIPTIALQPDWQTIPLLTGRYFSSLVRLLPYLNIINNSVGQIVQQTVKDQWVRRLIDLECFLLSGLKASGTLVPAVAVMLGERENVGVEYPLGGSAAIVEALVRGLRRWGGELYLGTHVERILVESGKVKGVQLRNGKEIKADLVISNATVWDTYSKLLSPTDLSPAYRQQQLATPAIDSFMHLHLGIKADGLEDLTGHHVIVEADDLDITTPGNTCMISIPSVWDKSLAPSGYHALHAYTLEPYQVWQKNKFYQQHKQQKAESLYRAIAKVIPDIKQRVVLEMIGSPLTHSRFLRRYQGTYGAGIVAGKNSFPSCQTPISGLFRVGDSTMPGIGVPAVAASALLCCLKVLSKEKKSKFIQDCLNSQKN